MKIALTVLLVLASVSLPVDGEPTDAAPPSATVTPGDNFVLENVPPVPVTVAEATARYGESRGAALYDWNPTRREVLIGTRFGDTAQVHAVAMPGGARRQLTFFRDRVSSARYLPDGQSMLLVKDVGGGEWYQFYRQDLTTGATTLLTDGRSRNTSYLLAHHGTTIVYSSTRRNNQDSDLWVTDAGGDPSATTRLLLQVEGGGWAPIAWTHDDRRVLVREFRSVTDSRLWLVDVASGAREAFVPKCPAQKAGESIAYGGAAFSADDRALYLITDCGSEFQRLARVDLASHEATYLSAAIPWGIEDLDLSEDGRLLAFVANEAGVGRLYALATKGGAPRAVQGVPGGIVSSLRFRPTGHELGFVVDSAHSPSDVYSINLDSARLDRWTVGETGGLDATKFADAELVRWKSFDGLELSGFLYRPDAARFPGRRPVMVSIHGGPEGQARPSYLGRSNYLIGELGVALVVPNVRGSSGYGKTFLTLDNGAHRDDTFKDIGALFDWIAADPRLDAGRVLVAGGSYGGFMTWAVSAFYNERIRCALPIVGPSNLVTFLEHTEAYRRDLRRVEYGDERDPAMRAYLERIAPLNHVEAMRKPVFAVVGRNDPRVPWTESRQIVDKLVAQGTPTWFMVANDEGHGYAKKKNQDFLFDAEVMFVEKCLLGEGGPR